MSQERCGSRHLYDDICTIGSGVRDGKVSSEVSQYTSRSNTGDNCWGRESASRTWHWLVDQHQEKSYLRWGSCVPVLQETCGHVVVLVSDDNGIGNGFAFAGLE